MSASPPQGAHQAARALLQRRGRRLGGRQVGAYATHGRAARRGKDPRQARAARDHGAGEQFGGLVLVLALCRRQLGHGHGFAREQGLVHLQLAVEQQGVGSDAVALAQHQQVAADHVAPGDALLGAIAHHQRARGRQVAQRLQGALRAPFLHQRDGYDHEHGAEQEQCLAPVAQRQVDAASGQQHQEHGLGEHLAHDGGVGFRRAAGQLVGAVARQPLGSFLAAQALGRGGGSGGFFRHGAVYKCRLSLLRWTLPDGHDRFTRVFRTTA